MDKPGTEASLLLLKNYIRYLLDNRLDEAGAKYLLLLQEAELPLLNHFSHFTPEELLDKAKLSLHEFLSDILNDRLLPNTLNKIKNWKNDQLDDIQKNQIEVTDLLLINSLRKQLLITYLPDYDAQSNSITPIIMALEKVFVQSEKKTMEAFIEIQHQKLFEKNQFLSQLIQNSVNGVWVIDKNLKILEWNPVLENKLKIKKKVAIGKNIFELLPLYKKSEEGQKMLQVFSGQKVEALNVKYRYAPGWYDSYSIPLFDKNNEVYGALNLIQDITARKEIELKLQEHKEELQTANEELWEQREELQAANEELKESFQQLTEIRDTLVENEKRLLEAQAIAHLGSWEYDIEKDQIYWSEEMKRIFGYTSDEKLDYANYLKMLHPDDLERVNKTVKNAIDRRESYSFEHRLVRKDGTVRYLISHGSAILSHDNKLVKLRGTGMDVTDLKVAELKNIENQNFIKKITDTTPDVITVFDLEKKKNIYANHEIYELIGYSSEEVAIFRDQGISGLAQLIHPDDFPSALELFEHFDTDKEYETKEIEYRIKSKKGEWLWILGRYNIFKKSKDGIPIQIIGLSRDITSRKLAEQQIKDSERRLKESQAMAHLGSWELHPNGKHVYWSDELYKIYKIPPKTPLTLEKILSFMVKEDRKIVKDKVEKAINHGLPYVSHYRIKRSDGEIRYLITQSEVIKDEHGAVCMVKGTTQDITDRKEIEQKLRMAYEKLKETNMELKQSEEALKELNNELENKVAQRTKELLESNERLLKKNADLDNFIYTASHDLKVPIANIEGLLNILKNKVKNKLPENEKILLNMMHESVERFNVTIQDLTEISKIQKNLEEESQERISIASVLNDLTQDLADIFTEKKASIVLDLEVKEIFFTKKNLRSILYNLVVNALKYSSPDRDPEILITTKKTKECILLSIQDNGLGIPENQLQKIFSLFKRYHTNIEGSGIGLYIVKRIIENNGGRIEVESKVNYGTTFKLFFNYIS